MLLRDVARGAANAEHVAVLVVSQPRIDTDPAVFAACSQHVCRVVLDLAIFPQQGEETPVRDVRGSGFEIEEAAAYQVFRGKPEDVVSGDPLTFVDARVANWFHAHATRGLTSAMLLITDMNGTVGISVLAVAMAFHLVWTRSWYWLRALLLIVPGGMLLNLMTKFAFHRARPLFDDRITTLTTYSFPSGHVAAATLLYGLLAAYAMTKISAWRWRVLLVLIAFLIIALVALSRIYLGAHYLSDVLAAFGEGVAWLALCLTAMHAMQQHRRR